jgi:hypothetical protein
MTTTFDPTTVAQHPKALGHIAMHYRPGEGPLAARFFELLGCWLKCFGPMPNGENFYIIALNGTAPDEPENIVFLSAMAAQQRELEQELAAHLGVGTDRPHPKLQAFFDHKQREPEHFLHFGVHFSSLEDLEAAAQRLDAAIDGDAEFAARIQGVQHLKARSGRDAEIDARMAASPVFAKVTREAYGQNIVQVHVRTDLFAAGLSFLGVVVEFDYAFRGPGRERNPFNDLIRD